jgi:hypothetical protein
MQHKHANLGFSGDELFLPESSLKLIAPFVFQTGHFFVRPSPPTRIAQSRNGT